MTTWTVRDATPNDVDTLVEFACAMATETEDKALPRDTVHKGVSHLLVHANAGFYLIAEQDGVTAGTLMVTTEWSDWRNGTFWWIQSVYVAPAARRQGVYRALYQAVQQRAETHDDICGYRLYVERENTNARKTYEALGMSATTYRLYEAERPK